MYTFTLITPDAAHEGLGEKVMKPETRLSWMLRISLA